MADLDLSPHPLVVGLGTALKKGQTKGAQRRKAATNAALHAQQVGAPETAQSGGSSGSELSEGQLSGVANLAVDPNIPELVAFGGYLGGTTTAPPGEEIWQILYLDAKLLTWVLVQQNEILFHQRLTDDKAAFNERDVIWVEADALVGRSSGPLSLWLSGDFTRAVDFTPPLGGGGPPPPATGIFCEATTPMCCPPRTR